MVTRMRDHDQHSKFTRYLSLALMAILIGQPTLANAALLSFKESINLQTMNASSSLDVSTFWGLGLLPEGTDVEVSGSFNDTGFTNRLDAVIPNSTFFLDQTGVLTGAFGGDVGVTVISTGTLGSNNVSITDEFTWHFDSMTQDYTQVEWSEKTEK